MRKHSWVFIVALCAVFAGISSAEVIRQASTNPLTTVVYSGLASECPQDETTIEGRVFCSAIISIPELDLENMPVIQVYAIDSGQYILLSTAAVSYYDDHDPSYLIEQGSIYLYWKYRLVVGGATKVLCNTFKIVVTYESGSEVKTPAVSRIVIRK